MEEKRAPVLAATKAAGIVFLNSVNPDNVEAMVDEGVMMGAAHREAEEKGRRYTKREMPW